MNLFLPLEWVHGKAAVGVATCKIAELFHGVDPEVNEGACLTCMPGARESQKESKQATSVLGYM